VLREVLGTTVGEHALHRADQLIAAGQRSGAWLRKRGCALT
jgi:hypothetical protein